MPNRLASMLMGGLLWIVAPFAASAADTVPEPQRVRELARAAYVWGYPMVDMYAILRSHVLDPASGEYKAPFNHAGHLRQVGTPADKVVVAPNLDTPYSYAWLDLRAEPVVPEDEQLRRDLATIGIAAGQPFRPAEAIRDGSWKAPPVVPLRD